MILNVRGFLFDMDGTTIDSNTIIEAMWARFCEPRGLDVQELLKFSHGRLMETTLEKYMPGSSEEERKAVQRELFEWESRANDGVKQIPGARALLERLDEVGAPWALVTSAVRSLAQTRFANVGLRFPDVAVTAERVTAGKPAPDGYLLAARELGLSAAECVVFEDAGPGVLAGTTAGAKVVVVGNDASEPTKGLPRIRDLENVKVKPSTQDGWFCVDV